MEKTGVRKELQTMKMNQCTAGFARLDITAQLGVPMRGRHFKRGGAGVHDPLYVNAIAFGEGDKSAVILVADLLGIYNEPGWEWPIRIAEEVGLDPNSVILCCTHSHTSPNVGSDEMYDQWVFRRFCDAATLALQDRKPVTDVKWAEGIAPGLAAVRRYRMKDGTVLTNPGLSQIEDIVDTACENDQSMRVIRILREEGPEIDIVNFQSHPDNTSGDWYSADYPGALRNHVEANITDRKVYCVFLDGAEGQMVQHDRRGGAKPSAGPARAKAYGVKLAAVALDLLERAESTEMSGMNYDQQLIRLQTKRDPSKVEESKRVLELFSQGRKEELSPSAKIANYMMVQASQICYLEERNLDYIDANVSCITFCGMALVGFPGEPFNEMGKQTRAASKFPVTCVCCQANGCHGYIPTAEGYDQGGYETYSTRFKKGAAEKMVEKAVEMLAAQ